EYHTPGLIPVGTNEKKNLMRCCSLRECGILLLLCCVLSLIGCELWLFPRLTKYLRGVEMDEDIERFILSSDMYFAAHDRNASSLLLSKAQRRSKTIQDIDKDARTTNMQSRTQDSAVDQNATTQKAKVEKWTINVAFFTMDCEDHIIEQIEQGTSGLGEREVRRSVMEALAELAPPFVQFQFYCMDQCQCAKWLSAHGRQTLLEHLRCPLLPPMLHWIFFDEYTFAMTTTEINRFKYPREDGLSAMRDYKKFGKQISYVQVRQKGYDSNINGNNNNNNNNGDYNHHIGLRALVSEFDFASPSQTATNKSSLMYELRTRSFMFDFFGDFMAKKWSVNTYRHEQYNRTQHMFEKYGASAAHVRKSSKGHTFVEFPNGEVMTRDKLKHMYGDIVQHDALVKASQRMASLLGPSRIFSAFPNNDSNTSMYLGYVLSNEVTNQHVNDNNNNKEIIIPAAPTIGVIYAHECQYLENPNVQYMLSNISAYCLRHNITLISVLNFTQLLTSTSCRRLLTHTSEHTLLHVWNASIMFVGFQPRQKWLRILNDASFLLGLGNPCFGPSVFETFASGSMFINILYDDHYGTPNRCLENFGARHRFRSQHDYAVQLTQKYGKEQYICSAPIWDYRTLIHKCIRQARRTKLVPWVPYELTKAAFNQRVVAIFKHTILRFPPSPIHQSQQMTIEHRYGTSWEKIFHEKQLRDATNATLQKQLADIDRRKKLVTKMRRKNANKKKTKKSN
ncbi:hypothetical protein RFI_13991, partial [Reticulomyxa filosa]